MNHHLPPNNYYNPFAPQTQQHSHQTYLPGIAEEDGEQEDDHAAEAAGGAVIAPKPFEVLYHEHSKKRRRISVAATHVCLFCMTPLQETHPDLYTKFYAVLQKGLGYSQIDVVFEQMKKYFDLRIRKHWDGLAPEIQQLVDHLTTTDVKEHMLYHINHPAIEVYKQITQYKTLRDIAMDHIVQSNEDQSQVLVDHNLFKLVEKTNTKLISLYKEKDLFVFKTNELS